eukprot:3726641-Pleurochrysis_carterae.AAC.1
MWRTHLSIDFVKPEPQPSVREKSLPVPSGITASGGWQSASYIEAKSQLPNKAAQQPRSTVFAYK